MAKEKANKEIIALSDYEHVRHRPGMYVGSIEPTEEKIAIIRNNLIVQESKTISIALYKLFNEILDNSFDALKRDKVYDGKIIVKVNSSNNQVEITDNAHGFQDPGAINKKTGLTNVETALSQMRAGSNFYNDDSDDTLIGTNGVGSAVVNMLSSQFEITTTNDSEVYIHTWKNFITESSTCFEKHKVEPTGTKISFTPDKILFKTSKYDLDYLTSQMVFRNYMLKKDASFSKTEFRFYYDEIEINLNVDFLPENAMVIPSPIGEIIMYQSFPNSTSISFINGTITSGIHQKIVQDYVNSLFKTSNAHHFYETFIILNLPPKLIRFSDQNKTKYSGSRSEIEPLILKNWERKIKKEFFGSELFDLIFQAIEDSTRAEEIKKIQKGKKESRKKISDKYFPPSKKHGIIFITEGQSAAGSLLQKRDSATEAVYALKGKVKNARRLSDLSSNAEIIDLITILGLDIEKNSGCTFDHVVIASDPDPDGHHISSLLINFFYKWFPHVITERRLNILIIPLISAEIEGKVKYFYKIEDFEAVQSKARSIRYLKGLGSLSVKDWEKIMKEKRTLLVRECTRTERSLKIAFGESADLRKKWLAS